MHPTTSAAVAFIACCGTFVSFDLQAYELAGASNWQSPSNQDYTIDSATWAASPSIHLLLGGEEGVGGGTSALRQHTSAWEGIYEQPSLFAHFGLQIRYLNEGYLGPTNVPWSIRLSQPLHYRDAYGLQLN